MNKVLVIGVDGMDSKLISKFEDHLPTIRKLKEDGLYINPKTVFPPDSDTSWASIYTGLNPAKHGILQFVDALEKSHKYLSEEIDNKSIQGRTFWDIAGRLGKKVCIIFPHLGYPPWPVNGIMIGRSSLKDEIMTYPEGIFKKYDLSNLNTIKGFPGRRKFSEEYVKRHIKLVEDSMKLGLEIYKKCSWDLFFIYSSTLDVVPHFFWNCCDENDPTYIGDNPYKDLIRDLYALHDKFIGKFISLADSKTTIIVHSDHGHGMRPIKTLNINKILRKMGLLFEKKDNLAPFSRFLDKTKFKMLDFVGKNDLENVAAKFMRIFPIFRKIYTSPPSIDWTKTIAYTCDLSGIKAYSYGGIQINQENIKDEKEYEKICEDIISELMKIEDPNTGQRIVKWALKRKELYEGEFLWKYPDILFQLDENYGAGWGIHEPLISESPSHNINPGSHKSESAVFIMYNYNKSIKTKNLSLLDIAPTILDILGIKEDFDFDGKSIFKGGA